MRCVIPDLCLSTNVTIFSPRACALANSRHRPRLCLLRRIIWHQGRLRMLILQPLHDESQIRCQLGSVEEHWYAPVQRDRNEIRSLVYWINLDGL